MMNDKEWFGFSGVERIHIIEVVAVTRQPVNFIDHLYQWAMMNILKQSMVHIMIHLDEVAYGLTLDGVEELEAEDNVTLASWRVHSTGKKFINDRMYTLYIDRISTIAKTGAKSCLWDYALYMVCYLFRQRYGGRMLCTGFVETVLGYDVTNDLPLEVFYRIYQGW
jgi:hypothetical protein